jgi:hypothetical protein
MRQTGLELTSGHHHPQCNPSQVVSQAVFMAKILPPPHLGHSDSYQANSAWRKPMPFKDYPHTGSAMYRLVCEAFARCET